VKKIGSIEALKGHRDQIKEDLQITVKVAVATCSKVAGADAVYEFFSGAIEKRGLDAEVIITGCMGYCYAEPTVEVTLPGRDPVIFGNVSMDRADQIIEKYMKRGEVVEGVIPLNYKKIQEIK
jgi:NADP-reducing hydrogenase subunit HndB